MILRRRQKNDLVVYGPYSLGLITNDDVIDGELRFDDFEKLLNEEFDTGLRRRGIDSSTTAPNSARGGSSSRQGTEHQATRAQDDATYRACLLSIRGRVKFLHSAWWSKNSIQADRAGLVSVAFAAHVLARRFIKAPDWPGHEVEDSVRLLWEFEWYANYCDALVDVCQAAQSAVREQRLILRKALSRTPLPAVQVEAWLAVDLPHAMRTGVPLFPGAASLKPMGAWPDALVTPPGAAYAQEVAQWAASDGIATASEVLELLRCACPTSKGVEPSVTGAGAEPAVAEPATTVVHRDAPVTHTHTLKRRAEPLAAVLALAAGKAVNSDDWTSVWASLVALAQSPNRPAPLLGYTEGDGVKYQTDSPTNPVGFLTREALRKRFKRGNPPLNK
jgi:hypothetical protein